MFVLSHISKLKSQLYKKMRIIGGTVKYGIRVKPFNFLLLISVRTKKYVLKCTDMFVGLLQKKQSGNTNLGKGFKRVTAYTYILW